MNLTTEGVYFNDSFLRGRSIRARTVCILKNKYIQISRNSVSSVALQISDQFERKNVQKVALFNEQQIFIRFLSKIVCLT